MGGWIDGWKGTTRQLIFLASTVRTVPSPNMDILGKKKQKSSVLIELYLAALTRQHKGEFVALSFTVLIIKY